MGRRKLGVGAQSKRQGRGARSRRDTLRSVRVAALVVNDTVRVSIPVGCKDFSIQGDRY